MPIQPDFGQPTEQVVKVPLERITESRDNPRKTYNEATLDELAASIKAQGVIQPIVLRELPNSVFSYEIVCGHRRYRASLRAGLAEIPALIRQMDDQAADLLRLHENLEREDVHYIEEAEAMHRLMTQHGVTAAQLMEQTGLRQTQLYARLKLAQLHDKVRQACLDGVFTSEIAILIGRWPLAVQPAAMAACMEPADMLDLSKGKVSRSYRMCRQMLRQIAIPIRRAGFDPTDATLPRFDGHPGACTGCPNNTDSDAELAEHFEAAQCLHRSCFEAKETAVEVREVEAARAEGRVAPVQGGRGADDLVPSAYMGHAVGGTVAGILTAAENAGLAVPAPKLLLDDKGTVVQRVYSRQAVRELQAQLFPDAVAAAAQAGAQNGADDQGDPHAEWLAQLDADQRAVVDEEAWPKVRGAIVAAARNAQRTADELRDVLLEVLTLNDRFHELAEQAMGWPEDLDDQDDPLAERRSRVMSMSPGDLAALLVLDFICEGTATRVSAHHPRRDDHISMRLALANRYGVDVVKVAEPTPTPAPSSSEGQALAAAAPGAQKGGGGARYRNPFTGERWSGKGLKPKWLQAALAAGRSLADFDTTAAQSSQTTPADAGGRTAEVST